MSYQPASDLQKILPPEKRDEIRARVLAEAPRWYNPYVHLALPSTFAIAIVVLAVSQLHNVTALELLTVPATWLFANLNEWNIHRDLLHRRSRLAPILYDRHTPQHHMIYITDDMAMREAREYRLVLIPAYGLFLISLTLVPITAAVWWLGLHNVALLYAATSMFYAASYEWLHLSYHLPADSFIGSLAPIRILRRHHAIHHDPRLMQRWNFNVTIPLGDLVHRTMITDRAQVLGESVSQAG